MWSAPPLREAAGSTSWWVDVGLVVALALVSLGIAIPVDAALHTEEVNTFSMLAVPVYVAILVALAHDQLRPYALPVGVIAVPGPNDHCAPMVAIGPPDEIGATLVPVLNHLDGILLVLTVIALGRPRCRVNANVRTVQFAEPATQRHQRGGD